LTGSLQARGFFKTIEPIKVKKNRCPSLLSQKMGPTCTAYTSALSVEIDGEGRRFCQKCTRFHPLVGGVQVECS
jgi:hypothetical protein